MNAITLIRFICGGRRHQKRRSRQSSLTSNDSWEGYYDQMDLSGDWQQHPCDRSSQDEPSKPSRRHTIATIDDRCLPEFKLHYDESIYRELEQMEQEIQSVVRRQHKEHETKDHL